MVPMWHWQFCADEILGALSGDSFVSVYNRHHCEEKSEYENRIHDHRAGTMTTKCSDCRWP